MKHTVKILALLTALLLLTGCVSEFDYSGTTHGGTTEPQVQTEPVTEATEAPVETTAPCVHEWIVDPDKPYTATCVDDGEEFYICTRCGDKKAEPMEAFGHNWQNLHLVSGNCETGTSYEQYCRTCGWKRVKTNDPLEHTPDWENPGRTQQPTCTEEGFSYAYCTACGERFMKTLEATGHSYDENGVCTACGVQKTPETSGE